MARHRSRSERTFASATDAWAATTLATSISSSENSSLLS